MAAVQSAAAVVPAAYGSTAASARPIHPSGQHGNPYADLLHHWCDALLTHQVSQDDPATHGGFLCPSCVVIHGRCGEAIYPLLRMASATGDDRYLRAALQVHDWSERQVSQRDGSWINDVTLSSWKGITVFHTIALAESLHHHGSLLDPATRRQWTARLRAAAKFLHGYITIETGNINYPVSSSLAFFLCGQVLEEHRYFDRARELAHASLDFFTPSGILFGEGHPQRKLSPKGCRPVDLGYDVEESLPSLGMYAVLANDSAVLNQVVAAMRTALEFMLPDGAWDNSWGTRNYKWSWWGSRTTDGCHPGFIMLGQSDLRFKEAALRNLELMRACTHNGLLYGGPDYFVHTDFPCIHHTFTHAKALAAVLDRCPDPLPAERLRLPRDEPYGLRSYPVIDTHLAAVGDWRATVTAYDCDYEKVAPRRMGGHVSGGSLGVLFHRSLGPVLTASMTRYEMVELNNQQSYRDLPHMPLTPRIEFQLARETYSSDTDYAAMLTARQRDGQIVFQAHGRLLSASRESPSSGDVLYMLQYRLDASGIEITASIDESAPAGIRFILPVIARASDKMEQPGVDIVRIAKPAGQLVIQTGGPAFEPIPSERSFNLVPGFECIPLTVPMLPGQKVTLRMEAPATA